jgi:Na+-transporting NADH:ubiquinone oxidoreductase subunit NqrF
MTFDASTMLQVGLGVVLFTVIILILVFVILGI